MPACRPRALLVILALLLATVVTRAHAAPWLCPECMQTVVERADDAAELSCATCGKQFSRIDMSPAAAYLNSRTRNVDAAWVVQSEDCELFRDDGLRVFAADHTNLWIPWVAVDWFIPRMRIVRLLNGREYTTDYPKGPTCLEPPRFQVELVDSVQVPGQTPTVRKTRIEEDMAALFIFATTPEGRASAIARFQKEVVEGKHPRLPRTAAKLQFAPQVQARSGLAGEVILEVRTHERGGLLRIRTVKSSGQPGLDAEALAVAQRCVLQPGGEMGVSVPTSLRLHFYFDGKSARVEPEPAVPGVWDE